MEGILLEFNGKRPLVDPTAFIAPTAVLIGDVTVGPGASVWFGAVLRGDHAPIVLGAGCNVQDNCVIHVGEGGGAFLGENVSVGHAAMIHNCTIRRGAMVGMRAIVLDFSEVGEEAMVGAGALVREKMVVPPRHLVVGVPARDLGELTDRARFFVEGSAPHYVELAEAYRTRARLLSATEL